jgi:hypothetical protein
MRDPRNSRRELNRHLREELIARVFYPSRGRFEDLSGPEMDRAWPLSESPALVIPAKAGIQEEDWSGAVIVGTGI